MNENDNIDNSTSFDVYQYSNLDMEENNTLKSQEEKMNLIIDKSSSIVKKIKEMGKEISADLQSQNKILDEIGLTMSRTNSQLKKNNSKIDDVLVKTSTCTLITLAVIQIIFIVILILL